MRVIPPDSAYAKEMAKWEQFPNQYTVGGDPPGNPYKFRPYPAMLYKAVDRGDGRASVGETSDNFFGGQPGSAENFTRRCQRIVQNESEHKRALEEGWRDSPKEAMDQHEALERAVADAAAHRHYEDRNMSEAAKREAAKVDNPEDVRHVPVIPEAPKKRRGRPPKAKPPAN